MDSDISKLMSDTATNLTVHRSLTSRTYERLRNAIITARFKPGEKLRIDALREEFDGSLGAVREALARLTSEELVVAEPQRGFAVALISRQDLIDLTAARIVIENTCLEQAIRHGDLVWEGRVLSLSHQLSKLTKSASDPSRPDAAQWHIVHQQFHDQIASACPNTWWLKLRSQLFDQSERYRRLSGPLAEYKRDIDAEHCAIADAVLARDVDRAKSLLASHLRTTSEILLASKMPFSSDALQNQPAKVSR